MVPTSDVRREVAERLRFCARETNGTRDFAMFLNHWIGVGNVNVDGLFSVKSDRRTAEMTLETLADLIDPTCHNADDGVRGGFVCSECGYHVEQDTMDADFNAWEDLRHCPHCGARVTSGGEG